MEEIGYQIYPQSFKDTNQDGIGDLKGIIEKLDYLYDLGITLLWICPVYQSPFDDNGYDISDYRSIHPRYGSMADMDKLLRETKRRNMKVIMDLVINHTSDEHFWFQEALKDPEGPYRDYYIFKEANHGKAPTNWRSVFGGSVWEKVDDNFFYFHSFSKRQPDLNWENPKMRHDIYEMIEFWLQKGIAGFRVDAINFIKKDQRFLDGLSDGNDGLVSCFDYCRNQKGIELFYQELSEIFKKYDCLTVCETVGVDYSLASNLIGESGCFSMMFDFNYTNIDIENEDYFRKRDWTIKEYRDALFLSQNEIQKIGWSAPFLENHDQPRSFNKLIHNSQAGNQAKKMLAVLFMLLRGTPFIYQGQELGMENFKRTTIEDFDDINAHSQYKRAIEEGFTEEEALSFLNERSRDNARTCFCWDNSRYGGFSDHEPWIKMTKEYPEINAKTQIDDPDSVYWFYKKLVHLRNNQFHQLLVEGLFEANEFDNENVISYRRVLNEASLCVICNFSASIQKIPYIDHDQVIINNYEELQICDEQLCLQGYQAVVLFKFKSYNSLQE